MKSPIRFLFLFIATFFTVAAEASLKKILALGVCGIFGVNSLLCPSYLLANSRVHASTPISQEIAQFDIPGIGGPAEDFIKGIAAKQLLEVISSEEPIVSSANKIFTTTRIPPGVPYFLYSSVSKENFTAPVAKLPSKSFLKQSAASHYSPSPKIAELPRLRQQNPASQPSSIEEYSDPRYENRYPFNPIGDTSQIISQLHHSPDGSVMLPPGDYAIPVTLYCMKQSASSPPGHRYLLAPLQGSRADVIAALNARVAGNDIPVSKLQALSWNIQAGRSYDEFLPDQQTLIDQFIPDYRGKLTGGFLENIESSYNQLSSTANLPSLEAALNNLGTAGDIIREYQQFQDTLTRYGNNYDALMAELIPTSNVGKVAGGAKNTPWSQLSDRLYGRLITENSAGGKGVLQYRVLPPVPQFTSQKQQHIEQQYITLKTTGADPPQLAAAYEVRVPITGMVADSQNDGIQPLTTVPDEETTEDPTTSNKPPETAAGYYNLGIEKLEAGNYQEALEAFDQAISINPDYVNAHIKQGETLGALGRDEEALLSFNRAADIESTSETPGFAEQIGSLALDFIPGVGTLKGAIEGLYGKDLITGEELEFWDRVIGVLPGGKALGKIVRRTDDVADAGRTTRRTDTPDSNGRAVSFQSKKMKIKAWKMRN